MKVSSLMGALVFGISNVWWPGLPANATEQREPLAAVPSRYVVDVRLRPLTDFTAYGRVLIESVRVTFHRDWLRDMNSARHLGRPVGPQDVEHLARDAAARFERLLGEAFLDRGYEMVGEAGPGVLRLSAAVEDFYLNAPEYESAWLARTYTREAGSARLVLEISDAMSGELLGLFSHRGTAYQMYRFEPATGVSNRFWFDALFSRWALQSADALRLHGAQTDVSSAPTGQR